MSKVMYSTVIILLFTVSLAPAQPIEEWVARYNGPGNYVDVAYALALDPSGNVYVTGKSWGSGTYHDYATIKYDSEGNQLWVARYNGPGNYWDVASALAVNPSGNVHVTGRSLGSDTGYDYATIKYASNGNRLWVARYNGPGNDQDEASAVALDLSGNVYVTGNSYGSGTGSDYATIKYDSEGNQLWVARYNGPGNGEDWGRALALDPSPGRAGGNVYVTGYSYGSGTDYDYATIKYDSDGNQLWVAHYNGPGNGFDWAEALALDPSGNVYVTGQSASSDTSYDYVTIKYDSEGNELWVARYNGPGNYYDWANALALDPSGNVYVTGRSYGSGTYDDYATIKYDSDGNELWVARYNGPGNDYDAAYALALDLSGNVYVTGYSYGSGTEGDYATIKYDSEGNAFWVARYNSPGNYDDCAHALALDPSGNVYVTGESYSSGTSGDYATIKYSQQLPIEVVVTPLNPPIVIPPEGGFFSFDGVVSNNSDTSAIVDAWSMVFLPTGHRRGPKVLIEEIYLAPHQDTSATFTHRVKRLAPPGGYTYVGYVGYYPDTKLDSSYFNFTKLGGEEIPPGELSLVFDIFGEEVESESPVTALLGAYPSPFNLQTNIAYNLAEDTPVRLEVFDILGRKVATLIDKEQPAGRHSVVWDASGYSSGVYFYKLATADFTEARRMTLVK